MELEGSSGTRSGHPAAGPAVGRTGCVTLSILDVSLLSLC